MSSARDAIRVLKTDFWVERILLAYAVNPKHAIDEYKYYNPSGFFICGESIEYNKQQLFKIYAVREDEWLANSENQTKID